MASSGGALNLSLLSRGVGEISKNGHERIDVVFEPQVCSVIRNMKWADKSFCEYLINY